MADTVAVKRSRGWWLLSLLAATLVVGVVLAGGCLYAGAEPPPQVIAEITPQEAFALIEERQGDAGFVIVDLQGPQSYAHCHIDGAVNLDYRGEGFQDSLDALDRDKTYLIYYSCRCGEVGEKTLGLMGRLGFGEVYHIFGGLSRWQADGLPVVTAD